MNIQHSSRSDEWYTPEWIIEKVRSVLGTIDLDPASNIIANNVVKASYFLTKDYNSLDNPWFCNNDTVFLNPPGGKIGNQSKTILFWKRLLQHKHTFKDAIFLAFSIEALQTSQGKEDCEPISNYTICIPSKRLKFWNQLEDKNQPSHSNMIVYVPGVIDRTETFVKEFQSVGAILRPLK